MFLTAFKTVGFRAEMYSWFGK